MARHLEETDIPIEYKGMKYNVSPSALRSKYGSGGSTINYTDSKQTSQVINWMKNWLTQRKDILQKNAEQTNWEYNKYSPRRKSTSPIDTRDLGWRKEGYVNPWNPLTYLNGSTPTKNRINKLIYSQIENAANTPKVNIGKGSSDDYSLQGVYVVPDSWDNSGHYIAFAGNDIDPGVMVHEFTHASHPKQQELYIKDVIFNGRDIPNVTTTANTKRDNASELYAALQQFRFKNKLKPKDKITKEWIKKNKALFEHNYLKKISDEDKVRLFNEVAQNNEFKNKYDKDINLLNSEYKYNFL